jgi:putative transposase
MSPTERKAMIRKDHADLSLTKQCKLLKVSRSSLYHTPVGVNAETLKLMNEIDRVFTKYPFFGSRQIAAYLPRNGFHAGRHRVRRLMGIMGLQAICKGPNTSKKHPRHPIYPYLLRKLPITRPNHVWCSDITYIPVRRGFLYLVAIMDWATRKVLAWRLSNTLDASFCVEALKEAIAKYGKPEIMNTDQGSQFTGTAWITTLTMPRSRSQWMGEDDTSTISSSNGSGDPSSRRLSTCTNCRTASKPNASSTAGSDCTTLSGHIPRLKNERPTTHTLMRYR